MDSGNWIALGAVAISASALLVAIKSARAATRSARTAAESLAHQKQESAERRAAAQEAARPRVDLSIEFAGGDRYRIVNHGEAPAENIRFLQPPEQAHALREVPNLAWNEGHDFYLLGSAGLDVPTYLKAVWDGQTEPVTLRMPTV